MRFGDEETDDPLPAIVDSIARSAYLPSLPHLASALDPRARSRHRPADARPGDRARHPARARRRARSSRSRAA
ncbi:hypothetical protein F01_480250 [Burkholderia cenocepacia]|nr:hypothetical protein F01_480250 [Burkholderia cenocepacia]